MGLVRNFDNTKSDNTKTGHRHGRIWADVTTKTLLRNLKIELQNIVTEFLNICINYIDSRTLWGVRTLANITHPFWSTVFLPIPITMLFRSRGFFFKLFIFRRHWSLIISETPTGVKTKRRYQINCKVFFFSSYFIALWIFYSILVTSIGFSLF